ncbi:XRE family transcriptional regulator [Anaerotruncus massiliensis (ex Liu et al. 2021)]|uniref:XRE family transcriptional regulator n=2 Tax=Anaerotruncus TaxID=244127 RepID=A0A498CMF4_9FIRM|nr:MULTISPECIES: helix-turn-helix transcriptional regulator [Anaerotruncus]MBC3938550.1 helix-turn-helix transcriptional regulator [Anaerotruncus massiliensis (ex Togo et al. 2019)]RLL12156.1 XRE family transcriptional regulator [Anaerotruncus massiliensis (ex Liu et al. 2021)]
MELRAAREASGKTQAQVARETGIPEQMYQRYEYDKCEPGVRTAIRIARVLGSTVETLFGAATPTPKE